MGYKLPEAVLRCFLIVITTTSSCLSSYLESSATGFLQTTVGDGGASAPSFQPRVAMHCGYINQYTDEKSGKWVTDDTHKTGCITERLDILQYCRKVYPDLEISNVVESSEEVMIEDWCKVSHKRCKWSFMVKPYRCLVGSFQSDALLVPDQCLFDHIHDSHKCLPYSKWNASSKSSCSEKKMKLSTFAMLLPCGIDLFSGVEFVCCPDNLVANKKANSKDESTARVVSGTDRYFFHSDPEYEHDEFKEAQRLVERGHRDKVTRVMKQWSEAEQHYQQLKSDDPKKAEEYKEQITERFQKTIAALEKEGNEERQQVKQVHQQRVQSIIDEKRQRALENFMSSMRNKNPRPHKVLKTLEKYIRMEEKSREHIISHYRHLVDTNPEQAHTQRSHVVEELREVEYRVNQSVELINRIPDVAKQIRRQIDDFLTQFDHHTSLVELHDDNDDTMKRVNEHVQQFEDEDDSLVLQSRDELLEKYKEDVAKKLQEKKKKHNILKDSKYSGFVSDKVTLVEDKVEESRWGDDDDYDEDHEDETVSSHSHQQSLLSREDEEMILSEESEELILSTSPRQHHHHDYLKHSLREKAMYMIATLSVVALLTSAIVATLFILRRRHVNRNYVPLNQPGHVVEIDTSLAASPEEKHVANMQMSGYENPTYKYFESH